MVGLAALRAKFGDLLTIEKSNLAYFVSSLALGSIGRVLGQLLPSFEQQSLEERVMQSLFEA